MFTSRLSLSTVVAAAATMAASSLASGDIPSFDKVNEGFTQVVSTTDGSTPLYGLYRNKAKHQLLAELPRGWASKKFLIAITPAGGNIFSGLQGPERYVYWKKFGDRLALVSPQIAIRSTGEKSSKQSVKTIFTDTVLFDIPIVATGPNGQPVIDLDDVILSHGSKLGGGSLNGRLAEISKAKAFPKNIEVAMRAPGNAGTFQTVHYSISELPDSNGYKPRKADNRIGYFGTSFQDLGQYGTDDNWTRYINRWNVQKSDPKLSLSPPKEPIVFYIDHTVPVRYRRWVRDGVLQWNEAFEKIGLDNAVVVYQQDSTTGAHMDKDPEDVRYNFIRWLNNDVSTAIGPSRAHPLTGQILDADVVLTDGWIRAFYNWYEQRPQEAAESLTPEAWKWLESYPQWDPRLVLARPWERDGILAERARRTLAGDPDPADSLQNASLASHPELAEIAGWVGDHDATCMAAHGLAMEMGWANLYLDSMGLLDADPEDGDILDGIPEWYIGPHLSELVAHEVGHTLGLRHNFKASSLYSLAEINSEAIKGNHSLASSVMDYLPSNFNVDDEAIQGDHTMIKVGPYDVWAIEYGYGFGDPTEVAARVGETGHAYLTDEDTSGPDPLARRYDFSSDPLDYAASQIEMNRQLRDRLLTDFVDDGESWEKVRKGYSQTLSKQRRVIDMMANWVGGTHVNRVNKGDADTGDPLEPVDVAAQRAALQFIIEQGLRDEAFGLSPELLNKMTIEKWYDAGGTRGDSTWPVHDQISGTQNTALTLVLNPSTLSNIHDNEMRIPSDEDAVTIPEVFTLYMDEIFAEVSLDNLNSSYTNRRPMISSLRRNLQSSMADRLIAFGTGSGRMPAPVRTISLHHLRSLNEQLETLLDRASSAPGLIDDYTIAHLEDLHDRTSKALDAVYVVN
jgi:hypothetical protein